jgi:phenylalanyl-tRNA synthetase beta chain
MPKAMRASEVIDAIKKKASKILKSIEVFDVYEGKNLKEGYKSLAFRLSYQDTEGTLSEEKIAEEQNKIIGSVCESLAIEVR